MNPGHLLSAKSVILSTMEAFVDKVYTNLTLYICILRVAMGYYCSDKIMYLLKCVGYGFMFFLKLLL